MPKKIEKFESERKVVLDKMFQILNINENNNIFSLHKMDDDQEKQTAIINLEDDIKKYFLCGEWSCFKKKDITKRRWLSLIKYVVKDMGYQTFTSRKNVKYDENIIHDTIYYILKK